MSFNFSKNDKRDFSRFSWKSWKFSKLICDDSFGLLKWCRSLKSASHPSLSARESAPSGAKHSPPGDHWKPDWHEGGSSTLCSGTPFVPWYLVTKFTKWIKLDMGHHSFWRSFRWYQRRLSTRKGSSGTRTHFSRIMENHEKWWSQNWLRTTQVTSRSH